MSMHINNHALKSVERQRRAIAAECCGSTPAPGLMGPPESESWVESSGVAAGCCLLTVCMADESIWINKQMIYVHIESIERIMWKLCSCPCLRLLLLNWQSSLHFHWQLVNRVGKSFIFFFWTQVQFIWGLVCPQSGLAMVWVWYGINLRLLHNYQLPILTHINQQIAVLWAKAEINWARDTNGCSNRRKTKQKQNRNPQEQPRGRAKPSWAEVAAHAPPSRLHNSQLVVSILLHIIYCVGCACACAYSWVGAQLGLLLLWLLLRCDGPVGG